MSFDSAQTTMPQIDILMATFNGECYLREQLDSIISQSYSNWRLLVSDDVSQDSTLDILRSYEAVDSRIQIVSCNTKYGGALPNFQSLLSYVESDYFMFCDQDDIWLDTKVEQSLNRIQEMERSLGQDLPLLVYTDLKPVDEDLKPLADSLFDYESFSHEAGSLAKVFVENNAWGCTMLGNYTLCELMTRCARLDGIVMHDWLANLVAHSFGSVSVIDQPTILYRQHRGQAVGSHKFSFMSLVKSYDINRSRGYWAIYRRQARTFLDNYSGLVDETTRKTFNDFLNIFSSGRLTRIANSYREGYLPTGFSRRLGQVIVFLTTSSFVD